MEHPLDAVEVRVLGSLMEKEIATPEYYPLSLNALVNACNQKSNREPAVNFDDQTVEQALESLRARGWATRITGRDVRVPKHSERLSEVLNLGRREAAVLCVLMLRGPQTLGEIRTRSERLYSFDDLEGVEATLNRLAECQPEPLVMRLARQAGSREARYAHLLAGCPQVAEAAAETPAVEHGPSLSERVAALEADVAELKRALEQFRRQFE